MHWRDWDHVGAAEEVVNLDDGGDRDDGVGGRWRRGGVNRDSDVEVLVVIAKQNLGGRVLEQREDAHTITWLVLMLGLVFVECAERAQVLEAEDSDDAVAQ